MTQHSNVAPLFPPKPSAPKVTDLSFVHDYWIREPGRRKGRNFRVFWNVRPSGDYVADCAVGQKLASEYLKWLHASFGSAVCLSWIVGDMPAEQSGLEVGFLCILAFAAAVGANAGEALVIEYEKRRKEIFEDILEPA
jgi:hypothetical protein